MAKRKGNLLGGWAFIIGVILAVIFGFLGDLGATLPWVLVLIGLIVGIMNIGDEETSPFLMSGAVLVIVSSLGAGAVSTITEISDILNALLLIFVPATIIVALKHVFGLARR